MGRFDDVVPVETTKDSFRGDPHPEADRTSLREVIEKHADDILEADAPADNVAHEPLSRDRDENGRFAPKSPKQISEALQPGEDKGIETQTGPAIESEPAGIPSLVPQSWAADAKEVFTQLPPRAQQEIVKRETDHRRIVQQATEKVAQVQRDWSDVDEALSPFKEIIDSGRASRGQILKNFAWYQQRMDNPETRAQTFRDMAASYGHSLTELDQQAAAQPQEPSYVREIRQQNQQLMQMFQGQQRAAQQNHQQTVLSEIQAFAQEKDASGNALRPHMEHVIDDMVLILPGLKANNPGQSARELLQTAYEKAIWGNASTRELEMRRAMPPPNPQKLERARRAAKMVNGEALGPETEDAPRDLRQHILKNAAKLGM